MRRAVLVHNPAAGEGHPDREALLRSTRRAGYVVDYASAKDDWQRALEPLPDLIVIAGGDGTVGRVARHVAGRGVPLAMIPLGTANNVATQLGLIDVPLDDLVEGWRDPRFQAFDVGIARGPWGTFHFLESVGLGLLADGMVEDRHGQLPLLRSAQDATARVDVARDLFRRQVAQRPAIHIELSLDGRDVSGEYMLLEVLNFGIAGPNLRLAPQADPADGLLDLVLVGDGDRDRLAGHLASPAGAASPWPLPVGQGRAVTISCASCTVHLDDQLWTESPGGAEPARIELSVQPAALTFLRPR